MPENEKRYTDRLRRKSDNEILYIRDTEAIHTNRLSELLNDAGFITADDVTELIDSGSSSGSGTVIDNEALQAANERIAALETQVESLLLVVNSLSSKVTGYHILSGIYLNEARLTMNVSEMFKLVIYPIPSTAGLDHVVWTSSNNEIVEINAKGTAIAKTAGEVTIIGTAYGLEGEEFDIQCLITVSDGSSSSGGESGQEGGSGSNITKFSEVFEIHVGDRIAIVNEENSKQLSTIDTSNNFFAGETYSNDEPSDDYLLTVRSGNSTGSFAFELSNGKYLALTNSGKNYLNVLDSITNQSSWTVEFDSENDKIIITNVAASSRYIQWNNSSPRFATYTSEQTKGKIAIYTRNEAYNPSGGSGSEQPIENEIESLSTPIDLATGEEINTIVYDSEGERTSVVYVED